MYASQELVTTMYESFYGLKEKPFTLLPDPDYLFLSPKHQRALTLLEYGMMNQAGFSVICGDTGAGKTTLIRRLLSELGEDTKVGLITNTHQSFGDLLNWVLMAFGLDGEGKNKAQMHQMFITFLIEQYAQNKHMVLIVDEAQNMNADTLEELRMLSNINADKDQVLQVILAGQPALRETLRKPELMQFAQRIAVDYYLESLSTEETKGYIHHRLGVAGAKEAVFTDEACEAIYKYSKGTPRLINLLCDTALVYGFAEQSAMISEQLVHDVVREQHRNSIIPTFNTDHSNVAENEPAEVESQQAAVENADMDAAEQKVNQKKVEQKPAVIESTKIKEAEKVVAGLTEQSTRQAVSAASGAEQAIPVSHTETSSTIEKAQARHGAAKENEDSNVTPINVRQADVKNATEAVEAETVNTQLEEKQSNNDVESVAEASDSEAAAAVDKKTAVVESNLSLSNQVDEVFPIVHIEENPKKGLSMMLVGLVGGMFIASIFMMVAAWLMFGSKNNDQLVAPQINSQLQHETESRELKALQKERDAAIAVTRALERERDAAITAAKAQEKIREAELRATKILAAQEREAEKRLQQAKARAREAERAEARALARERSLQKRAEQRETELEKQRIEMLRKERQRLDAIAIEERAARIRQREQVIEQRAVLEKSKPVVKQVEVKAKTKGKESFSAHPCNSPSAKFLSTCKK